MKNKTEYYIQMGGMILLLMVILISFVHGAPTGADRLNVLSNTTASTHAGNMYNISGSYVGKINISVKVQDNKWKGFVGNVSGAYTLQDASGSAIFDWSLTRTSGEVFATRNSTTITWSTIACASRANLELENYRMNHSNADDNITRTFNDTSHDPIFVAGVSILTDSCPTLNVYVDNQTNANRFQEIALFESTGSNIVYASVIEQKIFGFDHNRYDFEMIVPENGAQGFTGSTPYYLYVELD